MPPKREVIDIDSSPEVLEFIRKASKDGKPKTLRANGRELGILTPPPNGGNSEPNAKSPRLKRQRKSGKITNDDPLIKLAGIGRSGIPGGISGRKSEVAAQLYRKTHRS
jgi:hypothetical protein